MASSLGVDSEPVAAHLADRQTQAFLSGTVDPVRGITSPFPAPTDAMETLQVANTRFRCAFRDAGVVYRDPEDDGDNPELRDLPKAHVFDSLRVYYAHRFKFVSFRARAFALSVCRLIRMVHVMMMTLCTRYSPCTSQVLPVWQRHREGSPQPLQCCRCTSC